MIQSLAAAVNPIWTKTPELPRLSLTKGSLGAINAVGVLSSWGFSPLPGKPAVHRVMTSDYDPVSIAGEHRCLTAITQLGVQLPAELLQFPVGPGADRVGTAQERPAGDQLGLDRRDAPGEGKQSLV